MADGDSKKGLIGVVLVLAIGGYFGWPYLQWFRFGLEARDVAREQLGRFPEPGMITKQYPDLLKATAGRYGFAQVDVKMALEKRQMGPNKEVFVRATVTSGSHEFTNLKRSERNYSLEELEEMQELGVTFTDFTK